jgi:hypothetical protein
LLASAAEAASLFQAFGPTEGGPFPVVFLRTEFGCWEPQRLKALHSGTVLPRLKARPVTMLASKQSIVVLRFARVASSSQSGFRKIPKTMRWETHPNVHRTRRWGEAPSARCVVNANPSGGRTASAALAPTEVGISRCLMPDSHSGCAGDSGPEPAEGARGEEGVDESVD